MPSSITYSFFKFLQEENRRRPRLRLKPQPAYLTKEESQILLEKVKFQEQDSSLYLFLLRLMFQRWVEHSSLTNSSPAPVISQSLLFQRRQSVRNILDVYVCERRKIPTTLLFSKIPAQMSSEKVSASIHSLPQLRQIFVRSQDDQCLSGLTQQERTSLLRFLHGWIVSSVISNALRVDGYLPSVRMSFHLLVQESPKSTYVLHHISESRTTWSLYEWIHHRSSSISFSQFTFLFFQLLLSQCVLQSRAQYCSYHTDLFSLRVQQDQHSRPLLFGLGIYEYEMLVSDPVQYPLLILDEMVDPFFSTQYHAVRDPVFGFYYIPSASILLFLVHSFLCFEKIQSQNELLQQNNQHVANILKFILSLLKSTFKVPSVEKQLSAIVGGYHDRQNREALLRLFVQIFRPADHLYMIPHTVLYELQESKGRWINLAIRNAWFPLVRVEETIGVLLFPFVRRVRSTHDMSTAVRRLHPVILDWIDPASLQSSSQKTLEHFLFLRQELVQLSSSLLTEITLQANIVQKPAPLFFTPDFLLNAKAVVDPQTADPFCRQLQSSALFSQKMENMLDLYFQNNLPLSNPFQQVSSQESPEGLRFLQDVCTYQTDTNLSFFDMTRQYLLFLRSTTFAYSP